MPIKHTPWLLCATLLFAQPAWAEVSKNPSTTGFALEEVVAMALSASPRLQASGSGVAAAESDLAQAGVWLNPEIGVEVENVAGSGVYRGFDSVEATYGVTQQFQTGGKISARKRVAGKGVEIASLEQQATRLDIIRDVAAAYAQVVAAEETVRLMGEQKSLAEDVLESVSVRVGAAAAPLIQKSRAEVEKASATIALGQAMRERDAARKGLAAVLGQGDFTAALSNADFYVMERPVIAQDADNLAVNPELARLRSGVEQSRARLSLEQANALPDPRINVGVRDLRDSGDQAFVVGVSLPIPVFDANRGNIARARHEADRLELDRQQAVFDLGAQLKQAQEQMESAHLQASMLKKDILPSAEDAFRLSREGYGLGRFPYLEVLDAQRSLFAVKQQHIDALRDFHLAKAQVERLTAFHATTTPPTGESHVE